MSHFESISISSSLPVLPLFGEVAVPSGLPPGFAAASRPLRKVSLVTGGGGEGGGETWAALHERRLMQQQQQQHRYQQQQQQQSSSSVQHLQPYQTFYSSFPSLISLPSLPLLASTPPFSLTSPPVPPPVPPVPPVPPIPPVRPRYEYDFMNNGEVIRREEFIRCKRESEEGYPERHEYSQYRERRNKDQEHRNSRRNHDRDRSGIKNSRSHSKERRDSTKSRRSTSTERRSNHHLKRAETSYDNSQRSTSRERMGNRQLIDADQDKSRQRSFGNSIVRSEMRNEIEQLEQKTLAAAPTKTVGKHSIWDGPARKDFYRNNFDAHKLPYHPRFEQCELQQEDPIIIEKELDEVCESRDEPVSLVKLEPVAYEDPWADDNLSEGSSESSDAEQSESSGDNSDENDEERAAIRQAKNEVIQKKQAQKSKREAARQTHMLAWEPVLSQEEKKKINERTSSDCLQVVCLSDLADEGMTSARVFWLRNISVNQRVRGYRQKNQRAKRTTKRPTGPRSQRPRSEKDLIKAEVAALFGVCASNTPSALAMAKLRVGDDLEGETALLLPDTVPFSDAGVDNSDRAREEDGIVQDFLSA